MNFRKFLPAVVLFVLLEPSLGASVGNDTKELAPEPAARQEEYGLGLGSNTFIPEYPSHDHGHGHSGCRGPTPCAGPKPSPCSSPPPPVGTFCTSAAVPLHRYYNAQGKDHFYTTDFSELGNGNSVYVYEGVEGRCYGTPHDGSTPLYRYKNPDVQDHFYTEKWSEIEAGEYGYNYQGIACYISPEPRTGTLALYRYWSSSRTDHFYTTNWSELKAGPPSSFISERIPGWICPRRSGDKVVVPCSGSLGY